MSKIYTNTNKRQPKVLIITGLTASGKSGLANELALKYNGEIISVDSVQVFKGLDIGSAKEPLKTRQIIKHHLIDIKNFDESYDVAQFLSDAQNSLNEILKRDKLPIFVGGTGMYIKALLEGYDLGNVAADERLRANLFQEAEKFGNGYVWERLNKLNSEKAHTVHRNNLKRVIRYIEIEQAKLNQQKTDNKKHNETFNNTNPPDIEKVVANDNSSILSRFDICAVGIIEDRSIIYEKINRRVDEMMSAGLLEEVKGLIARGAKREMQSMNSIGYKEWFDYFDGVNSLERTVELIKQHSRNYSKRQLTYMKTMKGIRLERLEDAKDLIIKFLTEKI